MDDLKLHEIRFLEELKRGSGGALDVLQRCNLPGSVDRANAIAKHLRQYNYVITAFSESGEQGMHVELSSDGKAYLEERRLEEAEPIPTAATAKPQHRMNIEQKVDGAVVRGSAPPKYADAAPVRKGQERIDARRVGFAGSETRTELPPINITITQPTPPKKRWYMYPLTWIVAGVLFLMGFAVKEIILPAIAPEASAAFKKWLWQVLG